MTNSTGFARADKRFSDDYLRGVFEGREFLVFDGAMGTMLQQRGLQPGESPDLLCLTDADAITDIHRAYVEAGAQVVTTNTFGANARKLAGSASVEDVFTAAVRCARESGARYVAADIGPTGDLIFPMGELDFSDAYDLFAEQAVAAERAGADLVIIETMADVLEMAAAVLAVIDSCALPIIATMTFTASGRTFLGSSPRSAALALATLGVDALGVNCSAGPTDLQPVVEEMLQASPVPVIVQANAGLPEVVDGQTTYSLQPAEYAVAVRPMIEAGATIVGGCCGTSPEYISQVKALVSDQPAQPRTLTSDDAVSLARAFIDDDGGRDAEILEAILSATDRAALKDTLAEEYDE